MSDKKLLIRHSLRGAAIPFGRRDCQCGLTMLASKKIKRKANSRRFTSRAAEIAERPGQWEREMRRNRITRPGLLVSVSLAGLLAAAPAYGQTTPAGGAAGDPQAAEPAAPDPQAEQEI